MTTDTAMLKATETGKARKANSRQGQLPEVALRRRRVQCAEIGRLTGWTPEPSEIADVFHRNRAMPAGVREWRERITRRMQAGEKPYQSMEGEDLPTCRARLDSTICRLRELARILAVIHGTPDLGNKPDPVDELIYIILSRKTREGAYQAAYDNLKHAYPSWDALLGAPAVEVERLVWPSGLSKQKTRSIRGALGMIRDRFGSCTLDPLRDWADPDVEAFLCSLPEIQRKSAYCVMMYSLGRQVFPVDTHVGRVLARMAPFREIGVDLEPLDHKQRQAVLAELVPPPLRYSLHVNLVLHGRDVCISQTPRCDRCELRKFCATYRRQRQEEVRESGAPGFVDLFAGAGGLSTGFTMAGFRPLLAIDQDEPACRSYRLNHPEVPDENVLCRDIRTVPVEEVRERLGGERPRVLLAAPPCQGFSLAGFQSKKSHLARKTLRGYRIQEDARNHLYQYVVGFARELHPDLILMENVPGMDARRRNSPSYMDLARRDLEELGYTVNIWPMEASAHGVPQWRRRKMLVAARDGHVPARPETDYQDRSQRSFDPDALPPVTLDHAILDLPWVDADGGHAVMQKPPQDGEADRRERFYLSRRGNFLRRNTSLLFNHRCRYHNERDLELYALLEPGEDSAHAIERYGRRDLMRYRADAFDDKYARLRADQPCKTIVSHLAKDGNSYIHPFQVRSLTPREGARVQSFPDDFIFCGAPSDQWIQIGNAVPPLLALQVADQFAKALGVIDRS